MLSKLFTVKDLATLFHRDEDTIRRWLKDGDVFPDAFQVKRSWYVPANDVRKMIKKRSDQ